MMKCSKANRIYSCIAIRLGRIVVVLILFQGMGLTTGAAVRHSWKTSMVRTIPSPDSKTVALTFDDGPTQEVTPRVLEILKKEDVHATFFLVGWRVDENPDLVRSILEAGHAIGNHSYSHHSMRGKSAPFIQDEIERTTQAIQTATGQRTFIFRAPYGLWSVRLLELIDRLGYRPIHWTLSPHDWRRPSAKSIIHRCLARIQPGSIILLHDGFGGQRKGNRGAMLEALPTLIRSLKDSGYNFVTIPEQKIPTTISSARTIWNLEIF